jgi:hypothetical protein
MAKNKYPLTFAEREDLQEKIRSFIAKSGNRIYVTTRSVAKSGASRKVSVFVVLNGEIVNLTYYVGIFLNESLSDKNGRWEITLRGGGMDMHFKLAYDLGITIYGDGYAIKHQTI